MDNRKQTYDILNKLVAVPSVTGDLAPSKEVIDLVSDMLKPADMQQSKGEFNGHPYLVATTQKPDNDTLWFICHLDVVPAENNLFKITGDDENYYGRGVCDMKGMAAAVLAAFLRLPDYKKVNVGLMFTTDEEIGGKNGVGALVDKNFKGAVAYVFDQSADWVLTEKMKGVLWLGINAKGKNAHGARPWLGESANQKLVAYLHELKQWYDNSMPQTGPDNYYTTFNLGTINGGEATNQVSSKATATIDVRFVSEEDATKVISAAQKLAKNYKGISVTELMHEPCVITDTSEKWYLKTKELMQTLEIKPGTNGEPFGHGSTDGRYLAAYNIPVISTRPPSGGQHGPKEWVSKQGLRDLERLCLELMKATV